MKMLLLIIVLIGAMSCSHQSPIQQTKEQKKDSLPAFDMLLMDTITKINTAKIAKGNPIVLFFFAPDCPHCEALTKDIIAHINSLKNIRFYFLSITGVHDIENYKGRLQLDKFSNIIVAQDYNNYFLRYYSPPAIPYLVVYDENKLLKQVIIGEVTLDSIRTIIKK